LSVGVCLGRVEEDDTVHIDLIDIFQPRSTVIHRLDPRVKLIAAVSIIVTAVSLPEGAWLSFVLLACWMVMLSVWAGLGWSFTMRRALLALPFVLAALPLPFMTPGPVLWVVPGLGWTLTATGLTRFLLILLRTWLAVQAGALLSATTSAPDMLWGLRALGMPKIMVSVIGFMLRYIFVLVDEALRMIRARAARSPKLAEARRPGLMWQGRVAGMMVGSFFLRSLERSERVFAAMASRGYAGEIRLLAPPVMRRSDWLALSLLALPLLGLITLALWR
jgi:cobalt/nickel transport system permease protein